MLKKKILKGGDAQLERPGNGQNVIIWVKIMQENGDVILGRQKLSFTINGRDVIKVGERNATSPKAMSAMVGRHTQ